MLIEGKRTLAVCGIALVVLTGCSSDDKRKELAASKALAKIIVGGTLGDCLNIVGYDVDPSDVKNGTIPAGRDHRYRAGFQNVTPHDLRTLKATQMVAWAIKNPTQIKLPTPDPDDKAEVNLIAKLQPLLAKIKRQEEIPMPQTEAEFNVLRDLLSINARDQLNDTFGPMYDTYIDPALFTQFHEQLGS